MEHRNRAADLDSCTLCHHVPIALGCEGSTFMQLRIVERCSLAMVLLALQ